MTFSVDDLVASFNAGGHISQEAIDIANLQTQLAQTLAYAQQHHQQQHQYASPTHALCNTPTSARTPTMSLANWSALEQHQHRARSRSASVAEGIGMTTSMETVNEDMEMDECEELAVEQLLAPHTHVQPLPVCYRGRAESFCVQQNFSHSYAHPPPSLSHSRGAPTDADPLSVSNCSSPLSSSFAASDPFFAAAAAAAAESAEQTQNSTQQASFFAQIGRPSQHSPFAAAVHSNASSPHNQFGAVRFAPAATVDS